MHGLFDFKIHFNIKMTEKPHTVLLPDFWFLSFNKNIENSNLTLIKLIIYVSWSSPKTDLVRNFLNSENRNFENVSFS